LNLPVLYSFRRCPYAIRARMALHASGIAYELREVDLKNKPAAMLAVSPKGSVPVLVLPDGRVIDESRDIMQWALQQHDPENWLGEQDDYFLAAQPLIEMNDGRFKQALDGYKYADGTTARTDFRTQGEAFLLQLEARLTANSYLLGNRLSIADAAIFPFIRQFAAVDADWFSASSYSALRTWLAAIVNSPRFAEVMQKPVVGINPDLRSFIQKQEL
jgi:glutathione S-transferase